MMVPHPKPATLRTRSRRPDGITTGQSRSDLRWAAPRGPVKFALDSPLEGAVRCELVSAAGSDSAPYEFLESIKKEGRNAAMPCHLSLVIKINFTWL